MGLRISFELSDRDVKHFREAMRRARQTVRSADAADIIDAARTLFTSVEGTRVPAYVRQRIDCLEAMVDMIEDPEWQITARERERVLSALVYFSDPEDMIPDDIPGIGFLDDAIMVELAFRELRHEIEAYQDFRAFRSKYDSGFHILRSAAKRAGKLRERAAQLRDRATRRREKDVEQAGGRIL